MTMPTLAVKNREGAEVEKVELSAAVFDVEINTHCVRAAVNRQLARRRQGNASTKNRGQVRGSGVKPWRQKGRGRARVGSIRSPLWEGGGVIFGPTPRQFGGPVNRKVLRSAVRSCLTALAKENQIIVLDAMEFPEPKTRRVLELLDNLKINDGRTVLFLTDRTNLNLALSARNLPNVKVINCDNINTYDLTTHAMLVATAAALERVEETYR